MHGTKGVTSIASRITARLIDAELGVWIFAFLGLTLSTASCLTFYLGDNAGLAHEGFEDAVRPTKSDPIQPCFVSRWRPRAGDAYRGRFGETWHQIRKE
jgi:hypothetical protein